MSAPPEPLRASGDGPIVPPTWEDPVARNASEVIGGPHGRHSRGHRWWTPVRVVLAVACVAWLLAMVQKAPCAADGWSGGNERYAQMCYSDLPFLYVGRGFAERELPFSDSGGRYPDLEYPVLIGYAAYAATLVTHVLHGWPDLSPRLSGAVEDLYGSVDVDAERQDFFLVNAVLLAPALLLAAYFLTGAHRGRPWDAMAFVAAPTLVLTGLINWDALALVFVAGALWAWARGRPLLSGVMIGLGTAAKLYPLFLLGALLVVCLRRGRMPSFVTAVGGAVLGWAAANLPAWLYGFEGWQGFWTFNADRGPDLGSLWLLASQFGYPASPDTVNTWSLLVFAGACVGILVLGLRAPHPPRIAQLAFLIVLAFLLVNKVYSPQYVLWLLPLAVLARPRWRDLLIWQSGEILYFAAVWWYLGQFSASATTGGDDPLYAAAILLRVAAQLYLAVVVVRDILHPEHDPARYLPHWSRFSRDWSRFPADWSGLSRDWSRSSTDWSGLSRDWSDLSTQVEWFDPDHDPAEPAPGRHADASVPSPQAKT